MLNDELSDQLSAKTEECAKDEEYAGFFSIKMASEITTKAIDSIINSFSDDTDASTPLSIETFDSISISPKTSKLTVETLENITITPTQVVETIEIPNLTSGKKSNNGNGNEPKTQNICHCPTC